jgi:hypothetical protein
VNQFRTPRIPANYYFAKLNSYNVYYYQP